MIERTPDFDSCPRLFRGLLAITQHRSSRSGLARGAHLGLPDGALLAQFRPAPCLARLLVVFPLAKFFLDSAAFEQLLEPAQGQSDRFSIMHTHPQRHALS